MRQTNILGLALYDQTDKMNITGSENSLNHNMELIDEAIGQKVEESALNTAVESALAQAKENGDFNGDSGKSAYEIAVANGFNGTETEWLTSLNGNDGGFYTPIVTQPNEQTLHFAFNPSKEGMAEVAEIDVALPKGAGNVVSSMEPADDDLPKLFIEGNIPTSKTDVLATMRYVSLTDSFDAYLKIKCQGTSSMAYAKKNFTISMFSDEARTVKLNKGFKDWGFTSNKYVLKANYIDHSHARNICGAKLWGEVVTSRADYDTLPEQLRTSANNGAIDGFPVKLYTNGTYQGIYTWNIGKDAILWNMDKNNANHVLLCAETNTDGVYRETPCNFRALWNGVDEQDWSIEVGTNSDALKNSLNALISCVKDTDDATFKATIGNYLDIQSAIDYYIHQYVIAGLDGLAKNMLLGTYDLKKWYCGTYDMDSTFGLWWTGDSFVSTTFACPENYQEQFSLLWERIENLYVDELKARYSELRKTVYSFSNICTVFERFTDTIGSELYAEDLTIYTGIPGGNTNNIKQIRNYARDRLTYCDEQFNAMFTPISATGITLDQNTLSFTERTSITLTATLTPSDATDTVTWESSDTGVAIVSSSGVVKAINNGSCIITAKAGSVSATCSVTVSDITTDEYTELAYIESTGTQYIDTGVSGGTTSAYEIKFDPLNSQATIFEQYIAGDKDPAQAKLYFDSGSAALEGSNNIYAEYVADGVKHNFKIFAPGTGAHVVKSSNNDFSVDGSAIVRNAYPKAGWGNTTVWVCNAHEEPALFASMKLYYLKMWTDGELVRDFVPALYDGEVGLYDRVNGQFYSNAGTGTFIAGNSVQ